MSVLYSQCVIQYTAIIYTSQWRSPFIAPASRFLQLMNYLQISDTPSRLYRLVMDILSGFVCIFKSVVCVYISAGSVCCLYLILFCVYIKSGPVCTFKPVLCVHLIWSYVYISTDPAYTFNPVLCTPFIQPFVYIKSGPVCIFNPTLCVHLIRPCV